MPFFEKNLKILEKTAENVASLMSSIHCPTDIQVTRALSGDNTAQVTAGYSRATYYLHSPSDPVGEGEKLVGDYHFQDGDASILFGFGFGYLAKAIVEKLSPGHDLFIVEQRADLFKFAVQHVDLEQVLDDRRVQLCVNVDSRILIDKLKNIVRKQLLAGTVRKFVYRPATRLCPNKYNILLNDVNCFFDELSYGEQGKRYIPDRIINPFKNLTALCHSSSTFRLENALHDIPAVVVSAGPSLGKNLHQIKKAKKKSVIISTDAALKPLLGSETLPDVVVTVDPIEINFKKIEGISRHKIQHITLVYDPEVNANIPVCFAGPKFFVKSANPLSNWLSGHFDKFPGFSSIHTSAQLAFILAEWLGCDPIILAGFDFAFEGDQHHAKGSALTWAPVDDKTKFKKIKGVHKKSVLTIDGFIYMLRFIEKEIALRKINCIDATEGGALKQGARTMTMQNALEKYLEKNNVDVGDIFSGLTHGNIKTFSRNVGDAVYAMRKELQRDMEIIEKALVLLKGLEGGFHKVDQSSMTIWESIENLIGQLETNSNSYTFYKKYGTVFIDSEKQGKRKEKNRAFENVEEYFLFFLEMKRSVEILYQACRLPKELTEMP